MFVADCSEERQRFFTDPSTDWAALDALMERCVVAEGDRAALEALGLEAGNPYGLSKACANTYTIHLATLEPGRVVHACTPGFIETDMTRGFAEQSGRTPKEMGMKSPADGAKCPLFLLFGEVTGTGHYFGSDAERSPLDRYRAPGAPPFTGAD